MATEEERRLFGPNLSLLGRVALNVHHMHRHTEEDTAHRGVGRQASRGNVQRVGGLFDEAATVSLRDIFRQRPNQEGARPPELFHREVGGTHVFIGHSALAVVRGERVWAVTGSGVEVLS